MYKSKKDGKLLIFALVFWLVFLLATAAVTVSTAANARALTPVITSVKLISENTAMVKWQKVLNAKLYEVYVSVNGSKYKKLITVGTKKYFHRNLEPGTTYSYKVRAVSGSKKSSFSQAGKIKTLADEALDVTGYAFSDAVTLKWNKIKNASGYNVYKNISGYFKKAGTTTDTVYKIPGLDPGTTYSFRVVPYVSNNGKNTNGAGAVETVTTKESVALLDLLEFLP